MLPPSCDIPSWWANESLSHKADDGKAYNSITVVTDNNKKGSGCSINDAVSGCCKCKAIL